MNNEEENMDNIINKLFNNKRVENYIFVYTPPKVGSTTLVSSLRLSLRQNYKIIHIHDETMLYVLTGINNVTINDLIKYLSKNGKNVFVIDVYRTPIERKMSEYFEKVSSLHFNNTDENLNNYSLEKITNRFNKLFPYLATEEHYFEKYNIVPIDFDFEKKYTLQYVDNISYIKLRLSDINEWSNILSIILKHEIILVTDYQTENKTIGDLYNKFKNEYILPSNYFELVKNCKYFNFYNSEEERNKYLNKYKNKLGNLFESYTKEEYDFYLKLSIENQIHNYIQRNHYIDNECICKLCIKKRIQIYNKLKRGEIVNEKSIHENNVNDYMEQRKNKIINITQKIKEINENIKKNINNKKNKIIST